MTIDYRDLMPTRACRILCLATLCMLGGANAAAVSYVDYEFEGIFWPGYNVPGSHATSPLFSGSLYLALPDRIPSGLNEITVRAPKTSLTLRVRDTDTSFDQYVFSGPLTIEREWRDGWEPNGVFLTMRGGSLDTYISLYLRDESYDTSKDDLNIAEIALGLDQYLVGDATFGEVGHRYGDDELWAYTDDSLRIVSAEVRGTTAVSDSLNTYVLFGFGGLLLVCARRCRN